MRTQQVYGLSSNIISDDMIVNGIIFHQCDPSIATPTEVVCKSQGLLCLKKKWILFGHIKWEYFGLPVNFFRLPSHPPNLIKIFTCNWTSSCHNENYHCIDDGGQKKEKVHLKYSSVYKLKIMKEEQFSFWNNWFSDFYFIYSVKMKLRFIKTSHFTILSVIDYPGENWLLFGGIFFFVLSP